VRNHRNSELWKDAQMDATDGFPLFDNAKAASCERANATGLPTRVEDVIDLYSRFRYELANMPLECWGRSTTKSKILDELSDTELFRFADLWHDVKLPRPDGTDADSTEGRLQERRWKNFFYDWMQPNLRERWARLYELVSTSRGISYRRLFGKPASNTIFVSPEDYPPCCDHTTLWRRKETPSCFAEVFVTQPYWYDLDKMVAFAEEQGLWFWISERPAWHFPRGVFFIEWARPESQFAIQRGTPEADMSMRTIHAWKGKELLPGRGTVFTLKHPVAIKRSRDNLDINSLMWAELTRMIQLHDEDAAGAAH
jgi:hypothetical protein